MALYRQGGEGGGYDEVVVTPAGFVTVVSGARVDPDGEVPELVGEGTGRDLEAAGGEDRAERLHQGPLGDVEPVLGATDAVSAVEMDGHHAEPGRLDAEEVDDGAADARAVHEEEEVAERCEVSGDAVDGGRVGESAEPLDEDGAGARLTGFEDDEGRVVVRLREVEASVERHGQKPRKRAGSGARGIAFT